MQNNALTNIQQALLQKLGHTGVVEEFYLAGGTALALHLIHRPSEDFDFFTPNQFDVQDHYRRLLEHFEVRHILTERQTLIVEIKTVRISFMQYPYPLLRSAAMQERIRLASIEDIATMKLATIAARGAKRDFIDMYVICTECFALQEVLRMYEKRFGAAAADRYHLFRSLTYFQDAEVEPSPRIFRNIAWDQVQTFFINEVKRLV